MPPVRILFFTQPGCLSCELMKMLLEAKEMAFEERDISTDLEARREMTEQHRQHRDSNAGDHLRGNDGSDCRL